MVSESSSLEMWIGQAEVEQAQACSMAKTAMEASKRALAQVKQLKAKQERTSQQVIDILIA